MTKVLFCLAELSLSGAPWSCFHLARAVRQRDFSPALLVARAGPLEKVFREEGIPVHALRKSHWGFGPAQRYRKALDAAFQAVQPDLIHINNVFELGATVAQFARSRGVPVLWHVRENPEETRTLRLWPLIRSLSDFVVVNCDDSRRRLLPSAGSTPVASVANGLDEEFFFANRSASRPLRERFDIPENAQMVGTVGHVKSRKGTFVFVRAAARVLQRRKDARFLICGRAATGRGRDARYFQAIEEFVNSNALEDRILFLGEHGHMASVYQELDVVALPSQWDATSRVLLEAMACERPVVATQTGGLPEVLDDGAAGRLVAVDDEVDLAEKILELLESPETAGKLAKAGRQRFEQHYTIDRHVDSMVEVYRGILA